MNELQIINEQQDITLWNFEQIKEELAKVLSEYENIAYTDETMKIAKDDKSKLAKAKKLVEDQRKAYKAKCLAPYEELEPKIKEIVDMIEEKRGKIDDVVKDYTNRKKDEKEAEVRAYYDKKAFVLGELAEPLYEKLLDSKWLNASTSKSKYQEEMQIAINNALNDIKEIKSWDSPYIENLLKEYVSTLSVDKAKAKCEELVDANNKAKDKYEENNKAGINLNEEATVQVQNETKSEIKADKLEGVNVKIYTTEFKLNQICDFMKAIGVEYEIQ